MMSWCWTDLRLCSPLAAGRRERGGPGHGDGDAVRGEALEADDEAAAEEGGATAERAAGRAAREGAPPQEAGAQTGGHAGTDGGGRLRLPEFGFGAPAGP